MDKKLKALTFYRILENALTSTGIDKILVTMTKDGELEANVVLEKNQHIDGKKKA